ncbi:hypothetical protein [uncultured Mediterranean phage]|nr:hypothetical protein [uncultured Mediterranean phage]
MRYLIIAFIIIMLSACENTRHSMGVTAKPFAKGDKMEDSIKLNYKIVFGKVRNKNEEDED